MGAEGDIPKQVSGTIPHFWFDILGRIVPGAFLLVGLFSEDWHQSLTSFVHKFAADFPLTTHSVGFFLLFSGASFFVGHFLGVLSYYLIDRPVAFLWPVEEESVCSPEKLPLPEMLKACMKSFTSESGKSSRSSGSEEPGASAAPVTSKMDRFRKHKMLAKQSEAIAHWLWIRSPDLAIIISRWTAEALGGRSVALVSLILLISKWRCLSLPIRASLLILFFCGIATHCHYRNRSITNAFYFSTMLEPNPGGEEPKRKQAGGGAV